MSRYERRWLLPSYPITLRQPVLRQAGGRTAAVDCHTFLCHTDGPESAHSGHRNAPHGGEDNTPDEVSGGYRQESDYSPAQHGIQQHLGSPESRPYGVLGNHIASDGRQSGGVDADGLRLTRHHAPDLRAPQQHGTDAGVLQ